MEVWANLEGGTRAPKEYAEYQVMKEMGWTYPELLQCPNEVVQDIIRYMNTERKFYRLKGQERG